MNTALISIYLYAVMGLLNVLIRDATNPDQAHTKVHIMLWRHLFLWPRSMWRLFTNGIKNWDTPCDLH